MIWIVHIISMLSLIGLSSCMALIVAYHLFDYGIEKHNGKLEIVKYEYEED